MGYWGHSSFLALSAHCFTSRCFAAPFHFFEGLGGGSLIGFLSLLQGGWGDLRTKLTNLALVITLENRGGLVDYRAVIVACAFVIFLCHMAFCFPFSSVRVLPLFQSYGSCEKQLNVLLGPVLMFFIAAQVLQSDVA